MRYFIIVFLLLVYIFPISFLSSQARCSEIDDKISLLENSAFAKVYNSDDYMTRLERLEKEMFGASQRGGIEQRLSKLLQGNSYACYDTPNDYSAITYSNSDNKGLKGFWNKLKSEYTDGVVTGYTPSMYNSFGYDNTFGNGNSFSTYPFNRLNSSMYNYRNVPRYKNAFFSPVSNYINPYNYNFNPLNPMQTMPYRPYNNRIYPNRYNMPYQPTNINRSVSGGTKVTLIKD